MKRRKLTDAQRRDIVESFARFEGVKDIRENLSLQDIAPNTIRAYDCDNPRIRRRIAAKWIHVFEHARAAYLADVSSVPIANAKERLKLLQAAAENGLQRNDVHAVINACNAARQEVGGGSDADIARLILEAETHG